MARGVSNGRTSRPTPLCGILTTAAFVFLMLLQTLAMCWGVSASSLIRHESRSSLAQLAAQTDMHHIPGLRSFEDNCNDVQPVPPIKDAGEYVHPQIAQIAADFAPWVPVGIHEEAVNLTLRTNNVAVAVHAVTITNGVVVWDSADLEKELDTGLFDKLRLFNEHLSSVVDMIGAGVPNVTFLMTASSLPYLTDMPPAGVGRIEWARRRAPVLSIAKRLGRDGDVLVPNMYFGDIRIWDMQMRKLVRRARVKHPWSSRVHKVHWRGSCSSKFEGVLPRLRVVLQYFREPGMDIAFSNQCLSRFWQGAKPERVLSREEIKASSALHRRRVEPEGMGHFTSLLHMPGASSGSYSRSLQYQVLAGAAVMKLDNDFSEFYYSSLQEGVHFLGVNMSSLGPTAAYLRQHDDVAHALGDAVQAFAETHLSAAALSQYWLQVLNTHARLARFQPRIPASACVCPVTSEGGTDTAAWSAAPAAIRGLPRCKALKC